MELTHIFTFFDSVNDEFVELKVGRDGERVTILLIASGGERCRVETDEARAKDAVKRLNIFGDKNIEAS